MATSKGSSGPGASNTGIGLSATMPTFKSLTEETEMMLRRQRQKGADYKFREGPGRPHILDINGDISSADPVSMGATAKPSSPKKDATVAPGTAVQPGNLDDYDPKVQAEREREALVAFVSAKRTDASRLQAEVHELTKKYENLRIDLAQLAYTDDVDSERQIGLKKMSDLKTRIQNLDVSLEDTEAYQRTLGHMIKRGQEEKLSHLATLKAFEDAIRVHRNELELSEGVLRQVNKSRDDEIAQLHKMQLDVKKYLIQLDRKLEARRQEVKVSRDKAMDRMRKMRAEAAMKAEAEGDLTAEQERQLVETHKNQVHEAAELRSEKIRVQAEADAAETEYHRVRFAAGVPGPGPDGVVTEEGQQFPPPDPRPIVDRFAQLEDEVKQIEEQLADYARRLNALQQQKNALIVANQPRAIDNLDEEDVDITALETLANRSEIAKRALEGATREYEVARAMKLQLEQSITVLYDRLTLLSATTNMNNIPVTPELAEGDGIVTAVLEEYKSKLPTLWCTQLHENTVTAVTRLQSLMRSIDPVAATAALHEALKVLQHSIHRTSMETGGQLTAGSDESYDSKDFEADVSTTGAVHSSASVQESTHATSIDAEEMETDRRLDATIDSLVVKNEWSIRVRPGSSGGSRPVKAISSKILTDASSAFNETFKQINLGTYNPENTGMTIHLSTAENGDDPLSKDSVRQRRRLSRADVNTAFATAAAAHSGNTDGDDLSPRATGLKTKSMSKSGNNQANEFKGPKGEVVKKILATAALMAGDDVEDTKELVRKDVEEVVTREKMKRSLVPAVATTTNGKLGSPSSKGKNRDRKSVV